MPVMTEMEPPSSPPAAPGTGVSPRVVATLVATRPWARLAAVGAFVPAAYTLLAGLWGLVAVGAPEDGGIAFAVLTTGAGAASYLAPAIFLWWFADRTRSLERERDEAALERVLATLSHFCKVSAISMLVSIAFAFAGVLVGFVLGSAG